MTPLWPVLSLLTAFAADPAPPPASAAPPIRVVGFEQRAGGACTNRTAARLGLCLDVVDFFPLKQASQGAKLDPVAAAALHNLGPLYAHVWEDLAIRWGAPDLMQTIRADGYTALPEPSNAWGRVVSAGDAWSLPRKELYLGDGAWQSTDPAPDAPRNASTIFSAVRVIAPIGQVTPQPTSVLDGRFATRLGNGGRLHDFDLMDADPTTSGPFFEQMFPYSYSSSQQSQDDEVYGPRDRIPLVAFRFPSGGMPQGEAYDQAFGTLEVASSLDDAARLASEHFDEFTHTVFVQTAQFAFEDVTTNQMRVLAALTAMATPPDALAIDAGFSRDLVAAARYETDTSEEISARLDAMPTLGPAKDLALRKEQLPRVVLDHWVPWLADQAHDRAGFLRDLQAQISAELGAMLRFDAEPIPEITSEARVKWVTQNFLPGEDRDELDARVLRIALELLFRRSSDDLRARVEVWMLQDQVRYAIAATFDDSQRAAPKEVAKAASDQWQKVLGMHGYVTKPRAQGLGAVDPLSVCTTRDGVAALDEPSFGAVDLEQLVEAADDLQGMDVLQAVSTKLPFVFVDDPTRPPTVTRVIGLGNGDALYRVKWRVWTGWHLLWSLAEGPDHTQRLVLRTAAICDDTVLAATDLVPTVVRGALLAGNLRPTTPERPGDIDPRAIVSPVKDADDVADQLATAQERQAAAAKKGEEATALVDKPPMEDLGSKVPAFGPDSYEIPTEPISPAASWLQGLVRDRLRALGDGGKLAVFVFDTTQPGPRRSLPDLTPRTPYTREEALAEVDTDDGRTVQTAAWLWYFGAGRPDPVQLSPAYRPKESVAAADRIPRWDRRHGVDWSLGLGAGAYPFQLVQWACAPDATNTPSFSGDCAGRVRTAGATVDMQGLATWWALDQPRLGVDFGLEARLDVRPPGIVTYLGTPNVPTQDPADIPTLAWSLRFEAGALLGLRFAPLPTPTHTLSAKGKVWGPANPAGRSLLGRFQWGVRAGLLFSPSFNGTEGAAVSELWLAWSARRARGPQATFTPYHPLVTVGPYFRAAYGFPIAAASDRQLVLDHSWTAYVGLRTNLRLKKQAKLPEAK